MGDDAESGQPPAGSSSGVFRRIKEFFSKAKDSTTAKTSNGFMGLLTDNSVTLKNLLLSAVVVGLELLLSSEVFECPLNNHKAYGTSFLVAPWFIVFFTNLAILGELSKLTARCWIKRYHRYGDRSIRVFSNIIKALFGPTVWLVAAFADTTYYVCREVGQPIEKRNLTNETVIKALEQEFADAKTTSHIYAWAIFSALAIVTAIAIISKSTLNYNELLEDEYILEKREALKAMETFRKRTKDLKQDPGKKRNEAPTDTASGGASHAVTADPNAVTSESKAGDHDKDKDSTPELSGQNRVEQLFKDLTEKGKVHYLRAYDDFARFYPRIVSGKPWEPWVSDTIVKDALKKEEESRVPHTPPPS